MQREKHAFRLCSIVLTAAFAAALPAFAGSCSSKQLDIVGIASEAGTFQTLIAAVQAAGLETALTGSGPLTVFAPTDDAFAALPRGTVEDLLEPANRDRLRQILTYHVAPGRLLAEDVSRARFVETLNGQRPEVRTHRNEVRVSDARVIQADIRASNGIIHVIDRVLLPSENDIVETAVSAGSFSTLARALTAADLVDVLQGDGPFTVFAPTDEAFARLPEDALSDLLRPENRDRLVELLTYHVVGDRIYSDQAQTARRVATLQGSAAPLTRETGELRVAGARIVKTDIQATNGVIHVIDRVIMPETSAARDRRNAMELIELAVAEGAPLYNRHQPEACAATYRVAVRSLLSLGSDALQPGEIDRLRAGLRDAGRAGDPGREAWALRDALDAVYASLNGRAAGIARSMSTTVR